MPEAGLGPARSHDRGILSPLCLPIPPLGHNTTYLRRILFPEIRYTISTLGELPLVCNFKTVFLSHIKFWKYERGVEGVLCRLFISKEKTSGYERMLCGKQGGVLLVFSTEREKKEQG